MRQLVSTELAAGSHEYLWDGLNEQGTAVAGGQYFARLLAPGTEPLSRKLMLVR